MNQWILVLSRTKTVILLSDTSFMSSQCLKDKVGSTTNSFRAVLKHDRHLYRRGVLLPRLIIFIIHRTAYKWPCFLFNTCTDFEYRMLNRIKTYIVYNNCVPLVSKVPILKRFYGLNVTSRAARLLLRLMIAGSSFVRAYRWRSALTRTALNSQSLKTFVTSCSFHQRKKWMYSAVALVCIAV